MDLFAPSHLLIILVIVLIIFGPSKLGDLGGALGKALRDFKKAMNEPDDAAKTLAKAEDPRPANGKPDSANTVAKAEDPKPADKPS
jgi:sec-independent protein translocase protein TatA